MKLEAVKSFMEDPNKWQNFEYMITSANGKFPANSIMGFKRKRKFIDPNKETIFNNPRNGIYENNWYFTYDENDEPSLGTLEFDEGLEILRFQEKSTSRIIEYDISQILLIAYREVDSPNYPGLAANI